MLFALVALASLPFLQAQDEKKPPQEPPAQEKPTPSFLSFLAVEGKVAASTQNQALSALLFLYAEVSEPWSVRCASPTGRDGGCVISPRLRPGYPTRYSATLGWIAQPG